MFGPRTIIGILFLFFIHLHRKAMLLNFTILAVCQKNLSGSHISKCQILNLQVSWILYVAFSD
uniref:Uncharacterized protein n=1 Tax=Manihot esculenta TaxID=3983 RepID=A0A2C9US65_MANES